MGCGSLAVAITGASGVRYGVRLVKSLSRAGPEAYRGHSN